jgi:hypothetical protein
MATETIARTGHEPKPRLTRLERGAPLWREHASEIIASYDRGVWLVPSQASREGTSVYEVRLGRNGATSECPDHEFHPARGFAQHRCKHQIAARLWPAA